MGKIALILIVVLIIAGGAYFLITSGKISNPFKKALTPSLGEQIYTQTQNPVEDKLPETNPFAKINPFKGVYKNPFE